MNPKKLHGLFNVYRRADICKGNIPYNRRDFYKISLVIGTGILYYAEKGIEINRPALMFSNPLIPYSWEPKSDVQEGYFCLFTENFVNPHDRNGSLQESPLFKIGGDPIYFVTDIQVALLSNLFEKMLVEMESGYIHKYELLHNYVNLLLHEAMKMQPADSYFTQRSAASRITSLFIELLERQFPIDTPAHTLQLKTATDFANSLSVHVNHLNRSVKEVTGKTTTAHIADRIIKEAKALLMHTNWNINEIAYSLGFEYPPYFNNLFKKTNGFYSRLFS